MEMPVQWKAMVLSFPIFGNHFAQKVGNGKHIRIGADAIVGCGQIIMLCPKLIQY